MIDCKSQVLIVVQARTASTRLPGKVLLPILGKPMIMRQLERVQQSDFALNLVVATTELESDDKLVRVLKQEQYRIYRGSSEDVLDRYYQVAKLYSASHVVRITADCPLITSEIINCVVRCHFESDGDYTSNAILPTFPDGMDVEVMTFQALEHVWNSARLRSEREHVTLYIKNNISDFKTKNVYSNRNLSDMRWTVDEKKDLQFVESVYEDLFTYDRQFSMEDILCLLKKKPELLEINSGIIRDEGLRISIREDQNASMNMEPYSEFEN